MGLGRYSLPGENQETEEVEDRIRLSTTAASVHRLQYLAESSRHPQEQTEQFIPLNAIDVDRYRAPSLQTIDRRSIESSQNENDSGTLDDFEQGDRNRTKSKTTWAINKPSTTRYIDVLTRTLWLQSLRQLFTWQHSKEERKVAVYQDRYIALVRSIIHLIPLGIVLSLISLNVKATVVQTYLVSLNPMLQFAAKLVEVLIQTSLADIYIGLIRQYAVRGKEGLPLGSFFGPIQTTHISYLWSLDFWASLTANYQPWLQRITLFLLSLTVIALAALVGPSSAVLIIPRLHNETISSLLFFMENNATLFPHQVGLETVENSLESFQLSIDTANAFPQLKPLFRETGSATIQGYPGLRVASMSTRRNDTCAYGSAEYLILGPCYYRTVSTIIPSGPLTHITRTSLEYYYNSTRLSGEAVLGTFFHPLVEVTCRRGSISYDFEKHRNVALDLFPGDDPALAQVVTASDIENNKLPEDNTTSIFARSSPSSSNRTSTLLVYATWIGDSSNSKWNTFFCTIDAVWIEADMRFTREAGMAIIDAEDIVENPNATRYFARRRIIVKPDIVSNASQSLLRSMKPGDYGFTDETLSFSLAHSLSNMIPGARYIFDPLDYKESVQRKIETFLTEKGLDTSTPTIIWGNGNLQNMTIAKPQLKAELYGYRLDSVTVILSLTVLVVYAMIAAIHLAYTFITGETGSSWDTVTELFMLALNTRIPSHIQNTSAGVATLSTLRELVTIKANESGSLEVVFENDPQTQSSELKKIEPNVEY